MPELIPFIPSSNNYRLTVPLGKDTVIFDVRWNSTDEAWYMDIREQDDTAICLGIKIVLGINLGNSSPALFFQKHILRVVDTTGAGLDARYDDLGDRVVVVHDLISNIRNSGKS